MAILHKIKEFLSKTILKWWKENTPVKKNLILFESNGDLCDNSYPLYEYLLNNTKNYRFVCVVRDASKYKDTKRTKYVDFLRSGLSVSSRLKTDYYYSKAHYCFYTHRCCGIEGKETQKRIYLTHGFSYKDTRNLFWKVDFNSVIIRMSDYHRELGDMCNPGEMKRSISLGYPRTDVLVNGTHAKLDFAEGYDKVIVWLPTYKTHIISSDEKEGLDYTLITHENLSKINRVLQASNTLLVIKYHPAQKLDRVDFEELSNIRTFSNAQFEQTGIKLYDMLAQSDALITDFSSVFADYLLTDKPLAFEISDYESYKNDKGFIIDDPLSRMPGKFIYNAQDVIDFINDVINGKDEYADKRKRERDIIHKYQDGKSAVRILKYFKLI